MKFLYGYVYKVTKRMTTESIQSRIEAINRELEYHETYHRPYLGPIGSSTVYCRPWVMNEYRETQYTLQQIVKRGLSGVKGLLPEYLEAMNRRLELVEMLVDNGAIREIDYLDNCAEAQRRIAIFKSDFC